MPRTLPALRPFRLLIATLVLGAGLPVGRVWAQPAPAQASPPQTSWPTVAPLVERVNDTVVNVEVQSRSGGRGPGSLPGELPDLFGGPFGGGPPPVQQGLGSGFIIDAQGLVLTNNHVVEGATAIRVTLVDGRRFEARVVGRDPLTDVAVLRLSGDVSRLPVARLGNSDALRVGDPVVAIGNPFGLTSSVSAGILSARSRDIGAGPYDDFLQTDAAINPGNSGGPLFNLAGEVVGMNTAIVGGGAGIGFAVPSNLIRALLPQLEREGVVTRGYLGVSIQTLTPELARGLGVKAEGGAIVLEAPPDSPGGRAGLRPEDIVVELEGRPITSSAELTRRIALGRPGSSVRLRVLREGRPRDVAVQLGKRPDLEGVAQAQPGAEPGTDESVKQRIGVTVADVPADLAQQQGLPRQGALVTELVPGSPAADAGLEPGIVVVAVGNQEVKGAQDLVRALREGKRGQTVVLRVQVPGSNVRLLRALTLP